jgi:hypothetical protein
MSVSAIDLSVYSDDAPYKLYKHLVLDDRALKAKHIQALSDVGLNRLIARLEEMLAEAKEAKDLRK